MEVVRVEKNSFIGCGNRGTDRHSGDGTVWLYPTAGGRRTNLLYDLLGWSRHSVQARCPSRVLFAESRSDDASYHRLAGGDA
jgi:hypothetical protein